RVAVSLESYERETLPGTIPPDTGATLHGERMASDSSWPRTYAPRGNWNGTSGSAHYQNLLPKREDTACDLPLPGSDSQPVIQRSNLVKGRTGFDESGC